MKNLYELAKETLNNKTQWASGESVKLFENDVNKVWLKRDSIGQIKMFVTDKTSTWKSVDIAKVQLTVGYPGQFNCNQYKYERWVNQVKKEIS